MKVSEITVDFLKEYIRTDDDAGIDAFLDSAKAYIRRYTGMTDAQIDEHDDIVPVVCVLVADAYDNRQYTSKNNYVNKVVQSTLDMYSTNLL